MSKGKRHARSKQSERVNRSTLTGGAIQPAIEGNEWPGVFVSSTVYDLLDLRAELESHIRDLGLIPLLSDRLTSEFNVLPDRDSITTCLVNVAKSSVFICVLSQRYGPRLGKSGFDDVSATHLEYREARKAKLPIYFYARDRLFAEYPMWKKTKDKSLLTFNWVKQPADFGLFEFIAEHEGLTKGLARSNWLWQFRDSVELRQRISIDLHAVSRRRALRRLLEQQRVPTLSIRYPAFREENSYSSWRIMLSNLGPVPALSVQIRLENSSEWEDVGDLAADARDLEIFVPAIFRQITIPQKFVVRYSIVTGELIETTFVFVKPKDPVSPYSIDVVKQASSIVGI